MKWMTFNMRFDNAEDGGNAWRYRKDGAAEVIRHWAAEVIATQEMQPGMIRDLAALLPEYRWIGADRGDGEHCAVWYHPDSVELADAGDFMLSETPDVIGSKSWDAVCPRICTWALLRRREDGFRYAVFNVHTDHEGSESRWRSVALVLERMGLLVAKHGGDLPLVLMGDMNAPPQERCVAMVLDEDVNAVGLRDGFERLRDPAGERLTFHDFKGEVRGEPIDYIFHSRHFEPSSVVIDRRRVNGRYPSDHYPVVMETAYGSSLG